MGGEQTMEMSELAKGNITETHRGVGGINLMAGKRKVRKLKGMRKGSK